MTSASAKAEGIFCPPGQLCLALAYPQPQPFGQAAENTRGAARELGCHMSSGAETPGLLLSVVPTELGLVGCSQFGTPRHQPSYPSGPKPSPGTGPQQHRRSCGFLPKAGQLGGEQEMGIVHRSAGSHLAAPLQMLPGGFCPLLQLSLIFKT